MSMSALTTGLLVFARLSGLMLNLPLISARGIPQHVPIFLSLALTLIIAPIVEPAAVQPTLGLLALGLASEIVLGILLGSVVAAVFAAFAIGSDVMSTQMGYAMASIFDPITSVFNCLSIIGNYTKFRVQSFFISNTSQTHGRSLAIALWGILYQVSSAVPEGRA